MRKLTIAVAFVLLIATINIGLCVQGPLKVISANGSESTNDTSGQVISLEESTARSDNHSSSSESETKNETVENEDFIRNEISAGNNLFFRSLIDDIYENSSQSSVFDALTFVPNPYEDKGIVELYGGYLNLSLYMIVLFVLGAFTGRSLERAKLIRKHNMTQVSFVGGVAMCGLALVANILYAGVLDLIEVLNNFIVVPIHVIPQVPNPDGLLLFAIAGLCDLIIFGFFMIARYYVIYIFAVVCSVVVVLLVPEFTRDFATDCIEKIARILFLQPAALFVYVVCIKASGGLPDVLETYSYLGITIMILLTCWYFMFGNFTLLKKGVQFAIRKGVVKV